MNFSRIAIIDPVGQKAGMDHYDVSLARALNRKSFFVKVYSNFSDPDPVMNSKHFSFSVENDFAVKTKMFIEFYSALRKAKSEKTDVVILHLFHSSLIDFVFIRLARMFNFRICLIIHDVESLIHHPGSNWLNKCIKQASHVVVHNKATYDELMLKLIEGSKSKVVIIPHGNFLDMVVHVDRASALKKLNLDDKKKYILFFGMIKRSKGLGDLIKAMKEVSEEINLIIAGRTRDVSFEEYEKLIRELKLSERIYSIIRYISNEERNILFNVAEAVIIPYHRIYQSGVMIMGMSYGLPVIASDLPANRMMLNENSGLLFKTGNSSDLARKINSLNTDKFKLDKIANSAKEFVADNNNWEMIANEYANMLKK